MILVKVKRRKHAYRLVDARAILDIRLSWRARGILAYCLLQPVNRTIDLDTLLTASPGGAKMLRGGMKELRALGYAALERIRDARGHVIGSQWIIYECPAASDSETTPPR